MPLELKDVRRTLVASSASAAKPEDFAYLLGISCRRDKPARSLAPKVASLAQAIEIPRKAQSGTI